MQTKAPTAALPWLGSFEFYNEFEATHRAWLSLQRGRIFDTLGKREEALAEYRIALSFWQEPDAGLAPLREEARGRVAALAGTANPASAPR